MLQEGKIEKIGREEISPQDLPVDPTGPAAGEEAVPAAFGTLSQETRDFERRLIAAALEQCRGDREAAARRLGVNLRTLYRKLS